MLQALLDVGGEVQLENTIGDIDINLNNFGGAPAYLEIEKDLNPIEASHLLWQGLLKCMGDLRAGNRFIESQASHRLCYSP
jgi:hypothetical protein